MIEEFRYDKTYWHRTKEMRCYYDEISAYLERDCGPGEVVMHFPGEDDHLKVTIALIDELPDPPRNSKPSDYGENIRVDFEEVTESEEALIGQFFGRNCHSVIDALMIWTQMSDCSATAISRLKKFLNERFPKL